MHARKVRFFPDRIGSGMFCWFCLYLVKKSISQKKSIQTRSLEQSRVSIPYTSARRRTFPKFVGTDTRQAIPRLISLLSTPVFKTSLIFEISLKKCGPKKCPPKACRRTPPRIPPLPPPPKDRGFRHAAIYIYIYIYHINIF